MISWDWLRGASMLLAFHASVSMVMIGNGNRGNGTAPGWDGILEKYFVEEGDRWQAKQRGKRAITEADMTAILDLHNKLRGQVHPPAANMEHMEWDTELERTAEEWAETCLWEHGPAGLLPQIGQNLGAHWGWPRPPTSHVQAWYNEVKDYSFPYPQECDPYCPFRCSGPVCTHYTQLVWATSSRIGCAINICYNMNVWGQNLAKAVYLGNWWGHAPYKHGTPCSACPPSYGGRCKDNLCYKGVQSYRIAEISEKPRKNNYIEPEAPGAPRSHAQAPQPNPPLWPRPPPPPPPTRGAERNAVVNTQQMCRCHSNGCISKWGYSSVLGGWCGVLTLHCPNCTVLTLHCPNFTVLTLHCPNFTVLTSHCPNFTVLTLHCPNFTVLTLHCPNFTVLTLHCPNVTLCTLHCPNFTVLTLQQSSICRAGLHSGVVDTNGGWLDVTRQGRKDFFIKSNKNGIQSLGYGSVICLANTISLPNISRCPLDNH
uniref:Cysteine rich secretory protein LCCL domain containing 1 n=1 Tax=Oncorhynchus kisutch TaxID=8019 RepID=A0A8C7F6Z4_ONCKI